MSKKSIVLAICLSAAVSAFAQFTPDKRPVGAPEAVAPKPAVEVKLVQKKVVLGDKGVEQLADADSARPDDVIEYQASRRDEAVENGRKNQFIRFPRNDRRDSDTAVVRGSRRLVSTGQARFQPGEIK